MKRLTLLRHAKSSWSNPDLSDYDRPLNKRGRRDASEMGRRLAERGVKPDLVLASPACRSRVTVEVVATLLPIDGSDLLFDERIYLASSGDLIERLGSISENYEHVLLVGHNPGITDLANSLAGTRLDNVPTCGVISVELKGATWRELAQNEAILLFYDYPKKGC